MTVRGNIEAVYPVTPVQEGILFHVLYAPESPLYFQQYTAIIEGALDVELFRRSWDVVIARHQPLRSLLTWERRDQPLQIVRGTVTPEWHVEDWSRTADHGERLEAFLEQDRGRGFDLEVAPLMRFAVFDLGRGRHQFVWSHHHIVVDGWSMGIVLDEVFRSYAALAAGEEPDLPPPADYRAYVAWLREHDATAAEPYWRQLLAGFTAATPLRIERAAASAPWAERHAEVAVRLDATRTAELADVARRSGLTVNTLLRGAWALLLHAYSGSDDVVFGAASSGRPPAVDGAMDMVGMFVNTLPVRIAIDPAQQVVDWLHRVQDQQLATSAFETTPLAAIQRWSEVPHGEPLFTSLLVFENVPEPAAPVSGLRTSEVRYLQRSNYPLAVLVMPGAEMELIFLYDADRYDPAVIRRMAGQLDHVLRAMAAGMAQSLGDVSVLPPSELEEILVTWNEATADIPLQRTMHELIVAAAEANPDRVAVTDGQVAITYRELVDRAHAVASQLQGLDVAPNVRVAVAMERSPAAVVAIVGVLCAGGAYVPVDPNQPDMRRRYVLDDTASAAVIVATGAASGGDLPEIALDESGDIVAAPGGEGGGAGGRRAGPDDLAYVLFTSGSTGRPKGVAVRHRNLVASTHVRRTVYPGRVESFLLVSPFIFDSSLVGLFWTLYDGGTIVLPASRMEQDLRHLAGLVADYDVTHTLALPSLYTLLLEHAPPGTLESLQVVMVAGEACPPHVAERHHARLPTALLVNEYGPTEGTVWCTAHRIAPGDGAGADGSPGRIPIGRPIPNAEIYILDSERRPVPVGVPGELCIGGAGLAAGYLNHPELTEKHFVEAALPAVGAVRLYRTGDVGRFYPDGTIDLLGRLDHQVKIRGQRIELSEIEMVLRSHPDVREAAAVVHEPGAGSSGTSQPVIVAFVASSAEPEELRRYLAARMPEVMVPSLVAPLAELPLGATGKIDRKALPQPEFERARHSGGSEEPRSELERTLAGIWADVLGIERIGITDNFFELGGDSISSIRIIARAHEAGITLTPRQFFETPTVAELAAAVE